MRQSKLLALCAVLVLASGCHFVTPQATPTPRALPTSTVTPQPTPLPSATPAPATGVLDLGVSPADTYGVRGTALDKERGLLYIVAEDGDASAGQGVLTVVDLQSRQVRASVPLPLSLIETPTVLLSADGKRLYVATPDQRTLQVIDTDPSSLGTLLGGAPDVVSVALDPVTGRLYVIGMSGLRGLNAMTLAQEQHAALPDPVFGTYMRWLAANEKARLLYVTHFGAEVIAVYRLEDLSAVASIAPGGYLKSLVCAADRDAAYALMEHHTALGTVTRVVPLRGERIAGQSWAAEPGWAIGDIVWDSETSQLVLLEDSTGAATPQSRLRVVHPDTGQTLETVTTPHLDWTRSGNAAPCPYRGQLYSAGETLVATDLHTGVAQRIELGITLVSAALDEATNRLFVADSTGAIRVVDPLLLQTVGAWTGTLGAGLGKVSPVPLTATSGRLYVTDYSAGLTWVLDASSGARVGSIAKAGQVSVDVKRNRLFVTQDGVYLVDGDTYQVTGAVQETVRQDPLQVAPGALRAQYDPRHDLLFVTIGNNSPGSTASTWLQVYDGATLSRVERPFTTEARFVESLALSQQPDRLWVAGLDTTAELTAFALDGRREVHLQGLGGPLFPALTRQQLYVADWEGWVTVDTISGDVIAYKGRNLTGASFAILDARQDRLYFNLSADADLLAIDPLAAIAPQTDAADTLPLQPIQSLAVGDDGTVLAVNGSQWGPVTQGAVLGIRRPDGRGWWQISGGLPTRAWPVVKAAPGSPGVFFAFSAESTLPYGLFRSTDNGQTWHPAMRGLTDLRIVDLALSPNFAADKTAVLLAGDSGLFETRDGGESWTRLWSLSGYRVGTALTSAGALRVLILILTPNPENPRLTSVYAITDHTESVEWLGVTTLDLTGANALALSPNWSHDETVLAGYPLQLSQDGGRSWRLVGPETRGRLVACDILFSPSFAYDRTVYVLAVESLYGGTLQRSLLRSTDGGESWERAIELAPPLISALTIGPDGRLWAGDSQGMVTVLSPTHLTWQPVPAPTAAPPSPVPPTPVPTPKE